MSSQAFQCHHHHLPAWNSTRTAAAEHQDRGPCDAGALLWSIGGTGHPCPSLLHNRQRQAPANSEFSRHQHQQAPGTVFNNAQQGAHLLHGSQDLRQACKCCDKPKHLGWHSLISDGLGRMCHAGSCAISQALTAMLPGQLGNSGLRTRRSQFAFASISLPPAFPGQGSTAAGQQPACPLQAGQLVHDGRYRLVQQAADMRYTWLWLAEPLNTSHSSASKENNDASSSPPWVLLKVCKDPDVVGFEAGCRERDMTLAAQVPGGDTAKRSRSTQADKTKSQQPSWPADVQAASLATPDAPVVPCLDWFTLPGTTSGEHSCLVLKLLGDNLQVAAARYGQGLMYALAAGAQRQPGRSGVQLAADDLPANLGLPLPVVKRLARQLLRAIDHVHRQGLVHRAIYPEHVLLPGPFTPLGLQPVEATSSPAQGPLAQVLAAVQGWASSLWGGVHSTQGNPATQQDISQGSSSSPAGTRPGLTAVTEDTLGRAPVYLVDFGAARPATTADTPLAGDDLLVVGGHPGFRPPEELLGASVSSAYDIWQAGCLVWWLATGCHLFNDSYQQPEDMLGVHQQEQQQPEEAAADQQAVVAPLTLLEQHLAAMVCNFGPFPLQMVERCRLRSAYFRRSGHLKLEADYRLERDPLGQVLQREFGWEAQQATDLEAFLVPMFQLDPQHRPTAGELLRHPWLAPQQHRSKARRRRQAKQGSAVLDAGSDSDAYDSEVVEAAFQSVLQAVEQGAPPDKPSNSTS